MKCQKCGQNEVNFYYSSNVNGAVAETQLCSECAQGAGYDVNSMLGSEMFGFGNMFDGLMPFLGRVGFSQGAMPRLASRRGMNYPHIAIFPSNPSSVQNMKCDCDNPAVTQSNTKADGELTERRKLNMEMRAAVEMEDFEKAAELRDRIKELGIEN